MKEENQPREMEPEGKTDVRKAFSLRLKLGLLTLKIVSRKILHLFHKHKRTGSI